MRQPSLFVQECPTCGRRLLVQIDLLGRSVACQHCQAQFMARDPNGFSRGHDLAWGPGIMERAQALIESYEAAEDGSARGQRSINATPWAN